MKKRSVRAFIHLIRSFLRKMSRDKLDVYSAQSAFYLIMGVIPMLMLMLMFLKFTPLTEEMILETLYSIIDPAAMKTVEHIVGNVYHGSVAVVSIASFAMLWVSSRAILSLSNGLNSIYRVRENRNAVILKLRAMLYTILLIITFIVAFGILVAGMRLGKYLAEVIPIFRIGSKVTRYTLSALGLGLMVLVFNMLYVFLPNRKKKLLSQMYGAVFTTIAWTVYTWIYTIYLSLATNLSIIYGGLMTLMVTMLWLYFCLYLFFFGAEINAWKENPDSFPF